jgi:uncharacterized protein (TIGR02145 family)
VCNFHRGPWPDPSSSDRSVVLVLVFAGITAFLTGCSKEEDNLVIDIDGNVYHTVTIGSQEWMSENLKVTRYRNGDSISNITDDQDWDKLSTGAWCEINNEVTNAGKFGHLYNWYAVEDIRGLCPEGWHVPSDGEWSVLVDFLGGEQEAGGKLKSTDTLLWRSPNAGACDLVGFSGLPGGSRWQEGQFLYFGYYGLWWTATEDTGEFAFYRYLAFDNPGCFSNQYRKNNGCSVRCIKAL